MMADMAIELKIHNIATISLWPGAVLTETVDDFLAGRYGEEATARVCNEFKKTSYNNKYVVCKRRDRDFHRPEQK